MRETERIAYWIELTALSLVLLFAPAAATGHTGGVLQTKAQQACLVAMNKSLGKVAKAQGKQVCACIKDGAQEKLGTSIEDCLTAVGSKVEAAEQKTLAQWTDKCLQDVLQIPDFGYTSGPAVNAAGVVYPICDLRSRQKMAFGQTKS